MAPKLLVNNVLFLVNSRLGAFGAWSACSVRCGSGTQTRSRVCIAGNSCGAPCNGALTESRACGSPIGTFLLSFLVFS